MTSAKTLVFGAAVLDGILAGASVDRALIQLPAFRRLGVEPWAEFSRRADLDRGLWWYPTLALGGTALSIAAALKSRSEKTPPASLALYSAAVFAALGLFATTNAAPNMLRVGRADGNLSVLHRSFEGFERWHGLRAVAQALAFAANVASLRAGL